MSSDDVAPVIILGLAFLAVSSSCSPTKCDGSCDQKAVLQPPVVVVKTEAPKPTDDLDSDARYLLRVYLRFNGSRMRSVQDMQIINGLSGTVYSRDQIVDPVDPYHVLLRAKATDVPGVLEVTHSESSQGGGIPRDYRVTRYFVAAANGPETYAHRSYTATDAGIPRVVTTQERVMHLSNDDMAAFQQLSHLTL